MGWQPDLLDGQVKGPAVPHTRRILHCELLALRVSHKNGSFGHTLPAELSALQVLLHKTEALLQGSQPCRQDQSKQECQRWLPQGSGVRIVPHAQESPESGMTRVTGSGVRCDLVLRLMWSCCLQTGTLS